MSKYGTPVVCANRFSYALTREDTGEVVGRVTMNYEPVPERTPPQQTWTYASVVEALDRLLGERGEPTDLRITQVAVVIAGLTRLPAYDPLLESVVRWVVQTDRMHLPTFGRDQIIHAVALLLVQGYALRGGDPE